MPSSCTIRPATSNDADVLASIHSAARHDAMPWLPDLHTIDETRGWLAGVIRDQDVWVADGTDSVVAYAAVQGDTLSQLYVHPSAQGMGIGSALLWKAIEIGTGNLSLWTFQRNTVARAFYERRGFVVIEFTDGLTNEEREPDVRYQLLNASSRIP